LHKRYFITGGAGFIGAHLVNRLLDTTDAEITVFDNFSTGRRWAFGDRVRNPRLRIIESRCPGQRRLVETIGGHDQVYHFAANSDIARAQREPAIDFCNGTVPTHNVLEAMRLTGVKRITFTSGSGVYGEVGATPVKEDYDRMLPVSTYGACKLACEALISAYSFMFDMTARSFGSLMWSVRTRRMAWLTTLSGGSRAIRPNSRFRGWHAEQAYIHVEDVLAAFRLLEREQQSGYQYFNVGTQDFLTVRRDCRYRCERMGLKDVRYNFTGGSRGWKADVRCTG
jgi:UDP-glucose 4-epimerase